MESKNQDRQEKNFVENQQIGRRTIIQGVRGHIRTLDCPIA